MSDQTSTPNRCRNLGNRSRNAAVALLLSLSGLAAIASAPAPAQAVEGDGEVVLKLLANPACSLERLAARYRFESVSTVLASRRIHLVRSQNPLSRTAKEADKLAKDLEKHSCVVYAERNVQVRISGDRYHAWPKGVSAPSNEHEWRKQRGAYKLKLSEARTLSTGAGVTVAVLDTGVDATHPALQGHVVPGWDYVADDADPADDAGGPVSGHGTFIAGLVHLVAPEAKVISMRVLNSSGEGDGYVIAEAIYDAVRMGAKVVNLSFGTMAKTESEVLTDMIEWARSTGTLTVAAAGNAGTQKKHWPAADHDVVSVAALNASGTGLAWYSTRGDWVDSAALGTQLISAVPDGGYEIWSGTSMATPVVAAQLALILAADPEQDVKHVEEQLWKTSWKVDRLKVRYGGIDIPASIRRALEEK